MAYWKDQYINPFTGINAEDQNPTGFYSLLGSPKGDGTRNNPLPCNNGDFTHSDEPIITAIIGNGVNSVNCYSTNTNRRDIYIIGQNRYTTILTGFFGVVGDVSAKRFFYNLRVKDLCFRPANVPQSVHIHDCTLESIIENGATYQVERLTNSTLFSPLVDDDLFGGLTQNLNNCFIGVKELRLTKEHVRAGNYYLFYGCHVNIAGQSDLELYTNNYFGFDGCLFKIGNETDYTLLNPQSENPTEEEFREEFKNRCEAQGLTVPYKTHNAETLPACFWVFSNGSCIDGYIKRGSIIDGFQSRRSVSLGPNSYAVDFIPITDEDSIPQSFAPTNPTGDNLIFENNQIRLAPTFEITERDQTYFESKIIWLGGKHKIEKVDIINNLPLENGLFIGNIDFINPIPADAIEANKVYLVRSSDKQPASIRYNGETFTTSIDERKNILTGVYGLTDYDVISGNPVLFEVWENSLTTVHELRVVDDLPTEEIRTGNLSPGFWYFVAPDNMSDLSGKVRYNGKDRPCFDSFCLDVFDSDLTFEIVGNCHLRRCWYRDYNPETNTTDQSFWVNKQKPLYFNISPHDLRCLKMGDSDYSDEIKRDATGNYIGSGHPDFYPSIRGESGVKLPSFDITGAFIQLRFVISSYNPM